MIEVELKCELPPDAWPRLAEQLGTMQLLRRLRNVDTYYDTPSFDLLRQAVFVRMRNSQYLEFKMNEQAAPAHIQCDEYSFPLLPDMQQADEMNALFSRFIPRWCSAQTVEEALRRNHLIALAHIKNKRTLYVDKDLTVCVDHVESLGNFVEIEVMCEAESDARQAEARVQS